MQKPIYLDYAATTPVDPRVAEQMWLHLTQSGDFGNPASAHHYGRVAAQAVETARQQVAKLIHAKPQEIIWTSGATEANNLALKGSARFYRKKGCHIVTYNSEHSAVLDPCAQLEREGFEVTYLNPQSNGLIDLEKLSQALRSDTILVSIMHVNNETGVMQDIAKIGKLLREKNILFHVDAAQSVGKVPIDLAKMPIDLMSFSAHKIYGPKGIGALYVSNNTKSQLEPLIHGGGHEQGLRSGTLATQQIVGMGAAFALAQKELLKETKRINQLRLKLWDGLQALGNISLHGDEQQRACGILNVAFLDLAVKVLLPALKDIAISTGSACHAGSNEPSRVLLSMGVNKHIAANSLRFSFGRFTTEQEVDDTIKKVREVVKKLRKIG